MDYIEIVNLVYSIVFALLGIISISFSIFAILGIFLCKRFPKTQIECKYGIIIPARNEEKVIGNLIESIQLANYPQDKLKIFVVAHNCNDKTAEIARSYKDVVVYEYNNSNECTMGYAIKHLYSKIRQDFSNENYDGFFIFNADNIVSKNYFIKMNEAFVYYGKKSTITSYRNSKNFNSNIISGLCSVYFALGCINEARARTFFNISTRIQGTGYVFPKDVIDGEWNYVSLTEDWEFTTDQILQDRKIYYCDEAVFYDEQPTSFKVVWRQRLRWQKGHLIVSFARLPSLIRDIFKRKSKNRFSKFDFVTNISPITLIITGLTILQIIFLFLSPLFGFSLKETFFGINEDANFFINLIFPRGFFVSFLRNLIISYLGILFVTIASFVINRNRIKNLSFFKMVLCCVLSPFQYFLQFVIDVAALLSKSTTWAEIKHENQNNISDLE